MRHNWPKKTKYDGPKCCSKLRITCWIQALHHHPRMYLEAVMPEAKEVLVSLFGSFFRRNLDLQFLVITILSILYQLANLW